MHCKFEFVDLILCSDHYREESSGEGVWCAKKDFNLAKHPEIDVPNLQAIKLMQSFKPREYVRETFAWMHYYWFLTNDGIEFLRNYLNLPSEIVPATLRKQAKPAGALLALKERGNLATEMDTVEVLKGLVVTSETRVVHLLTGPGGSPGFGRGSGGYGAATTSNLS
ncbi:hypothetical protein L6164_028263 [Bauhinia variegata]|uniref:Uncharacterized protein n=1 Tax=Bauhinia variegata TaxID=167791 RepID=A0ACB9LX21_BAUVA|nr:hypothetical protein L6164_028263 [Bauhinia variegata]